VKHCLVGRIRISGVLGALKFGISFIIMCPANESGANTDTDPLIQTGQEEQEECYYSIHEEEEEEEEEGLRTSINSKGGFFHGILHRLPLNEVSSE